MIWCEAVKSRASPGQSAHTFSPSMPENAEENGFERVAQSIQGVRTLLHQVGGCRYGVQKFNDRLVTVRMTMLCLELKSHTVLIR